MYSNYILIILFNFLYTTHVKQKIKSPGET